MKNNIHKKNLIKNLKTMVQYSHGSSIAQLVEQLTVNQLVVGSSPTRGAFSLHLLFQLTFYLIQ